MANFNIKLDDKPHLSKLMKDDVESFKTVVGTFVGLMEVAAEKKWHKLPDAIHSSLSFQDVVVGVLNGTMTTKEIDPTAYNVLEDELHPLSLLSDRRKDLVTGEPTYVDWRSHFVMDTDTVSRETLEQIIRKMFYLMRWFDIDTVSKSLMTSQFPVINNREVAQLPFQPALYYQKNNLGELHVGKFFHDVGALNCGTIEPSVKKCPACHVGNLVEVKDVNVCPRCNAGFELG